MTTSSSTLAYEHALVSYLRPEFRMDYGWYAHIFDDKWSGQMTINRVRFPKNFVYDNCQSPQHLYFNQYLKAQDEKLTALSSFDQAK